ncbi:unnamed protein product [Heterobilharzia americana]|nr:unnamed protein product [Heterobilharzia americana]
MEYPNNKYPPDYKDNTGVLLQNVALRLLTYKILRDIRSLSRASSTSQSTKSKVYNFTSQLQSLTDKSKNILMNQNPYQPPPDVESRIQALSEKLFNINPLNNNNGDWKTYRFQDNAEKYKIFTACINEFKHTIVNSRLHEINTINDLIEHFLTPVDTLDFLSKLKSDLQNDHNGKLPPNLNIQVEPIRYNPNEDDFFK